jgi:hypothetical protein
MPDVFDERFPEVVERAVANAVRDWKDDPWCIGYFVDNELSWGGWGDDPAGHYDLPRRVLAGDWNLPAKREFVRLLQGKYGDIAKLNIAWKANLSSWEELLSRPIELPAQMTDACIADLSEFLVHFARRYFSAFRDALKKHAPNQLYLGCRFAPCPMEVVGEFHFGALDRGMFHEGLIPVASQKERGEAYRAYLHSVWKLPAFVGCHWFQYVDQPLTGRFDGENYDIGFVSIVDHPHWELAEAAREINGRVYVLPK